MFDEKIAKTSGGGGGARATRGSRRKGCLAGNKMKKLRKYVCTMHNPNDWVLFLLGQAQGLAILVSKSVWDRL